MIAATENAASHRQSPTGAPPPSRCAVGCRRPALLLLALLAAAPASAARTDVVVLQNGDSITGEVKDLTSGRLRYKTDDMGTLSIEWLKIQELTSTTRFEVETSDARRFVGRLEARGGAMLAVVGTDGTTVVLPHPVVVRLTRLEDGFWKRLEGSFDLGLTHTRADDTTQLNFDLQIRQRRPDHQSTIGLSGIITDRADTEATRRIDSYFAHVRLRRSKWFTHLLSQLQSNEELGLDLRALIGGGIGRTAIQTNRSRMQGLVGLAALEEWPSETNASSGAEAEAFVGASYSFFTFDYPATTVDISTLLFQSLSSGGGLRMEANISLRRELLKDFYWSVSAYDSFDDDPIVDTASQNDWGLTTSFGWTF